LTSSPERDGNAAWYRSKRIDRWWESGPISAERAVDGDLVQGALEEGELLIIEAGHELLGDPAGVGRQSLGQPRDADTPDRR
jgi:hypothetical protein